jgi:hypothetical protein
VCVCIVTLVLLHRVAVCVCVCIVTLVLLHRVAVCVCVCIVQEHECHVFRHHVIPAKARRASVAGPP